MLPRTRLIGREGDRLLRFVDQMVFIGKSCRNDLQLCSGLGNKRAFVTGGSRGTGRAIVWNFINRVAHVAFVYEHSVQSAEELAATVQWFGQQPMPCRRALAV